MRRWRGGFALLLLLVAGPPLLTPLLDLVRFPEAWKAWDDVSRILSLASNTALLTLATVALAIPTGVILAILLYRCDLPGRFFLHTLIILCLFIPLPLLVSGWEGVLASAGEVRRPGLISAILLHAVASLPWVICLVGIGLSRVERSLEEDALLIVPAWRVIWSVTLRRSRLAILAAVVWIIVQTGTEIAITDLYQVRTFAEEVYTQLVRPETTFGVDDPDLLAARAIAVSLPALLMTTLLLIVLIRRAPAEMPPLGRMSPPLLFSPSRYRGLAVFFVYFTVIGLFAVPTLGLLRQAGIGGSPPFWSLSVMLRQIGVSFQNGWDSVLSSVLVALWVGVQTAILALVLCWLARESRWFFGITLAVALFALVLPGPVVGLGMKTTIDRLLDLTDSKSLVYLLYDGPSYLPVVWVQTVRLFPFALALLWPTVRMLPRPLFEAARLDGARPGQELTRLVVPLMFQPFLRTAVIVSALSLGEIGASKLVSTPGAATFSEQLFMQLHYSAEGDLAARSLLLLACVAGLAALHALLRRRQHRWT